MKLSAGGGTDELFCKNEWHLINLGLPFFEKQISETLRLLVQHLKIFW